MTSNSKTKQIVVLAVLLALGLVLAVRLRRPDVDEPQAPAALDNTYRAADNITPPAAVIDQKVCGQCHAEIVANYARSGMSHTWRAVGTAALSELQGRSHVADHVSGYDYLVSVTDAGIEQCETRPDDAQHQLRRQATYLVGSGKHAIAGVASDHGYLTQLPAAWFRHDRAWRMNPGFELHNHRFDRPITPGCVACHSTAAVHEPPTVNRFQLPIGAGIGCQRCHGPAAAHVAFWSGEAHDGNAPKETSLASILEMTSAQANDLCLQCHLQGDAVVYLAGSDVLEYRPGERLQAQRHDFLVDSGEPSVLGIASHGARMLQSRCYTESGGALTCILCHNPHQASTDFDAAYYDSKCATCHTAESCQRDGRSAATAGDAGCIACHMPQRSSQEGIHLVFTDHSMVRQPAQEIVDRAASALAPNAANVKLVSAWPDGNPGQATLGAAYVLLHETMGPQIPALERGVGILSDAVRLDPDDVESRFWLGSALAALGRGKEAIPILQPIVANQPDRHLARFRLAIAHELVGDYAPAMRHYQHLVDRVPSWIEPYRRLAPLYHARRAPGQAAAILIQQLSYQPNALALAQLSLADRMRGASHEAALARVNDALRLNPRLPAAYLHRAALWLLVDRPDLARADFQHVLQFDPENQQARQALQRLAAEGNR